MSDIESELDEQAASLRDFLERAQSELEEVRARAATLEKVIARTRAMLGDSAREIQVAPRAPHASRCDEPRPEGCGRSRSHSPRVARADHQARAVLPACRDTGVDQPSARASSELRRISLGSRDGGTCWLGSEPLVSPDTTFESRHESRAGLLVDLSSSWAAHGSAIRSRDTRSRATRGRSGIRRAGSRRVPRPRPSPGWGSRTRCGWHRPSRRRGRAESVVAVCHAWSLLDRCDS